MAEPDSSMRVPKGILKNKYGGGSSGGREGGRGDYAAPLHYGHGGVGVGTIPGGWDPQLGMPVAPVPAPQHGMNMPNPVLDHVMRGIKSEFPSVHQKMHEFIESKRDLLFRPLDPDETPVSEVSGAQRNNEDHYGIVPSIDHFLRIDVEEVKRHFLQNAQRGDIVIGKVISRNPSGLSLRLVCTEADKHVVLDDVNLRSFCPAHQVNPVPDPRDPSKYYDIDDYVRAEILEIHTDSEKIVTGLKGETLSPELLHSVKLGLITKTELPRYYTLTVYKHSRDPRHRRTYHEMLVESPGFQNPSSVSHLALNMGIYNNANSLIRGIRTGYPPKEKAKQLRRVQNAKWAHGHVAEGIKYFKQEKFTEAFQCLNTALNIDPENIEGLVARGALYAKNGNCEKAIEDFEAALKLNPNHFNARKYLAETLVAYGRQQEGQGKLEDAIATYSKSLVVRPDHKEATEALLSLHARTEKLDATKMTGPAAAKAAELKAKLKAILQQGELGFRMEPKSSKEKKSKKDKKKKDSSGSDDDSSSSSSSDDSSSDSSSSGSGYKKKSKKRKKKKSKKSKKSRRESGSERKPKELSLSPFSKRLAEPHGVGITSNSGFSGFTDSHYAELQLGISKHDSDNESKRSGKKSKDKKRSKKSKDKKKKKRHASSDSSSSESETERAKKKSKKHSSTENAVIQGNIPGLEDLEAKLSAYYSKIEQDKIGTNKLPSSGKSRSRSKERKRNSRSRSRSKGRAKLAKELYHDIPPRVVENVPMKAIIDDPEKNLDKPWCERKAGKIDLQTDEYGNIVQSQPQTIIRTVKNDVPVPEPSKPTKFEMKFKSLGSLEGENGNVPNVPTSDLGSKWRPLGAASSQSEAVKNAFERASSAHSNEEQKGDISSSRDDHYYRRVSRSPSRSPLRRRRRSRTRSRSRSISRSRSRSRSYSRSRSRSRSPSYRRDRRSYRRDGGQRGRAPVRFFRGYNYSRGPRRSYNPRPFPREFGNGGGNGRSRFRNRFSHTPSRSRSRSRSRSYSPRERRRDQSRDRDRGSYGREERSEKPYSQSQEATTSRMEADSSATQPLEIVPSPAAAEIQIGTIKTTSTADVEYLLDKRNAEKKEEIRKSNPEFFRTT